MFTNYCEQCLWSKMKTYGEVYGLVYVAAVDSVRGTSMVMWNDADSAGEQIAADAQLGIQANYRTEKTFGFEKNGKTYSPKEHVVCMVFSVLLLLSKESGLPEHILEERIGICRPF